MTPVKVGQVRQEGPSIYTVEAMDSTTGRYRLRFKKSGILSGWYPSSAIELDPVISESDDDSEPLTRLELIFRD